MDKSYYRQKIFIPEVDENDTFIAPIERWKAHEKGILHRAFTIAVFYQDQIICQHRKHPVFDEWFDLTASSHPQVVNGSIQSNEDAVKNTLYREWNLNSKDVSELKHIGSVIYKTPDPNSTYIEHELCHFFTAKSTILPIPNLEISYGYSLQSLSSLKQKSNPFSKVLAPWVKEAIEQSLF